MAKTVTAPPKARRDTRSVPDEWFNGEWWEIIPGKDVPETDPGKAQRALYQVGRYRGKTPRTRVRNGKVYLQRR